MGAGLQSRDKIYTEINSWGCNMSKHSNQGKLVYLRPFKAMVVWDNQISERQYKLHDD